MKQFFVLFFCVVLLVLTLAPAATAAPSWWPLVPCGLTQTPGSPTLPSSYYQPCNRCELLHLLKNLTDFVVLGMMPILATLFIVWAGFKIMTEGAFPGQISKGKQMLKQTLLAVLVISAAWLLTNTFIRSIAKDNIAQNWWQFQCRAPSPTPVPSGVPTSTPTACSDPAALARDNNVPPSARNSRALDDLITCVRADARVAELLDTQQIFTWERTNDLCNYTRGQELCGGCQHSEFSCHYGGRNGTQGSEAVDFNSRGSEQELYNRILALRSRCNFGYYLFEDNHTHVSTQACSGN